MDRYLNSQTSQTGVPPNVPQQNPPIQGYYPRQYLQQMQLASQQGIQQAPSTQYSMEDQFRFHQIVQQQQQNYLAERNRYMNYLLQGMYAATQNIQQSDTKINTDSNKQDQSTHTNINSFTLHEESVQQPSLQTQLSGQNSKLTIIKDITQKKSIEEILLTIVKYLGAQTKPLTELKSQIELENPNLAKVFELLLLKYSSQKKSREEVIKYIMRKAFKFLFKSVQKDSQDCISLKVVTKMCLDHYFQGQDLDQKVHVLPFRKNSNIKTMNTTFLEKIFSSPTFVNDYRIFLTNFEEIIMKDNDKKIVNIAQNIQKFISEDTLNKIKAMRRMPWTLENLKQGKQIAEKLLTLYAKHQEVKQESELKHLQN